MGTRASRRSSPGTEWHDGGTTDEGNLVHLCRRCHLIKTTGCGPSS
ncbi:HNH endonuclease [uncultured Amnibacterium sp.]